LETFQPRQGTQEAVTEASSFAQWDGPPVLLLVGVTGCGKSHLLEGIGRYVLGQGKTVRYETASTFLNRLRHTFSSQDDEDIMDLILWYQKQALVILDDLGAEAATDWAAQHLTSFIDQRIQMGMRMAIATNCTQDEMAQRLGDRLASRLFQKNADLGEVNRITLTATDYRMEENYAEHN